MLNFMHLTSILNPPFQKELVASYYFSIGHIGTDKGKCLKEVLSSLIYRCETGLKSN